MIREIIDLVKERGRGLSQSPLERQSTARRALCPSAYQPRHFRSLTASSKLLYCPDVAL